MNLICEIGEGLLDIPQLMYILLFKAGVYSIVFWGSVLFCAVLWYFEKKGVPAVVQSDKDLIDKKVQLTKLKRYEKGSTCNNI